MKSMPFHQVDVFTQRPLYGNPLAVYLDADDVATELMQRIAREMNLSETTFVQRSTDSNCVFRVRVFTPGIELPFAGHPTVGTAFVLTRQGMISEPEFKFQMKVGPVRVRREGEMFWISPPPPKSERNQELRGLDAALGLSSGSCIGAQIITNGVRFLAAVLANRDNVDLAKPNRDMLGKVAHDLQDIDVLLFAYENETAYSRMFPNPEYGILEDPATGGSVAPLSLTLKLCKRLDPTTSALKIEQGTKMGRQSLLHARFKQTESGLTDIEVGGTAVHNFESILKI
ncbi:MAG: PhzF family phenazine biosynthesis protein [Candidatus Eremiobacteraeota bacterium]|nr:PhzF family phenazine biosynthesis protein [Candidatus Eremiobacteraeota bacterium]